MLKRPVSAVAGAAVAVICLAALGAALIFCARSAVGLKEATDVVSRSRCMSQFASDYHLVAESGFVEAWASGWASGYGTCAAVGATKGSVPMANVLGVLPASSLESSAWLMFNSCMNMSGATIASRRAAFQMTRLLHYAARNTSQDAYAAMQRTMTSRDCRSVWPESVQPLALSSLNASLWQPLVGLRSAVDRNGFSQPPEQLRVSIQLRQAWTHVLLAGAPHEHADLLLLERQMAVDVHLWIALRSLVSWSFLAGAVPYNASLQSAAEGVAAMQIAPAVSGSILMTFGGLLSSHLVLAENALQSAGSLHDESKLLRQHKLLELLDTINGVRDRAVRAVARPAA